MNDRETIRQFLEQEFGIIIEGQGAGTGAVSLIGLVHHAHSGDVPLHTMTSKSANWGKADAMAELFDSLAVRHCRGIAPGSGSTVQQLSLQVCRGEGPSAGRPTATLPFCRASAPHVVAGGAAGYTGFPSEPANATGALAQVQRLMETLITGAFSQIQHVTTTQAGLVDKLSTRLDVQEKRSDERWIALQSLLTQWQQQSLSLQLRALGVEAGRRMLPLLPGMLSTLTGSDRLIPERAVEDSLFDTLLESTTPEQLQELLGTISSTEGGAALGAVLSDHLLRARKRKAARAKEHAELLGGQERSYDDAEADAAGVAGGIGKANGHANGHAPNNGATQAPTEPKTRAREAGMMPGDAMLDAMLLTLAEGEVAQVAAMFGAKRPDLPGLGDEIRARYVRLTGKAVP